MLPSLGGPHVLITRNMKKLVSGLCAALCLLPIRGVLLAAVIFSVLNHHANGEFVSVEAGPHHRVQQTIEVRTNKLGAQVIKTNTFTELATGLNILENGQWQRAEPQLVIQNDKVVFAGAQHAAVIQGNLNHAAPFEVTAPEGTVLKSRPYGLAYVMPSGESVLIAETKASVADVDGNTITFRDAFTDFKADIQLTFSRAGFEHDVVLRERPPAPSEFGLDDQSAQLVVLTSFIDPPPLLGEAFAQTNVPPAVIAPNLTDRRVVFGNIIFEKGRAFDFKEMPQQGLPSAHSRSKVRVGKSWLIDQGMEMLVESVNYSEVAPSIENLPEPVNEARVRARGRNLKSLIASTPVRKPITKSRPRMLAKATDSPGFVLDYATVFGTTNNYVLKSSEVYFVSDVFTVQGTLEIQGGTVCKFGTNAMIKTLGTVYCDTSLMMPAIFTSQNDSSVGVNVPNSTGVPGKEASTMLYLDGSISHLKHLRMTHGKEAIYMDLSATSASYEIEHAQFADFNQGIHAKNHFRARNILMVDVLTNFYTPSGSITSSVEHITIHRANTVNPNTNLKLAITNGLIVQAATATNYTGSSTYNLPTNQGVFASASGGHHYLTSSSVYRGIGTTNVYRPLRDQLRKMTTSAPLTLSGEHVGKTNVLSKILERGGTSQPDIGYHYPAVDYLLNDFITSGGTVHLTNGVVVSIVRQPAFVLADMANFYSGGAPFQENVIVHPACVQESVDPNFTDPYRYIFSIYSQLSEFWIRFTKMCIPAGGSYLYDFAYGFNSLNILDSEIYNADLNHGDEGNYDINLINNSFHGGYLAIGGDNHNRTFLARNNNFFGSIIGLGGGEGWTFKDNIFAHGVLRGDGIVNSHNGYISNDGYLTNTAGSNIIISSFFFERGPFGNVYLPEQSPLVDAGSVNATDAAMAHMTTSSKQVKDTGKVDIGRHFVALVAASETVWLEDGVPTGATASTGAEAWNLVTNQKYQGTHSLLSAIVAGVHQQYFTGGTTNYAIEEGDEFFVYLYPSTSSPPSEIMVQIHAPDWTTWTHRAAWGADSITWWGPRVFQGAKPTNGYWHRLQFAARDVDMERRTASGMAFTLYDGQVNWDSAGILRYQANPTPYDHDNDGLPDYAEDVNGNGVSNGSETDWQTATSPFGQLLKINLYTPLQ